MSRSSSIFSSNNYAVIKGVFTPRYIHLVVFCFACFPYVSFDRMDAPFLVGIEALILAAGMVTNKHCRKYLFLFFISLIAFLCFSETVFRVRYFGLSGLSFRDYCPAGAFHPLSNFEADESTYTGLKPNTRVIFKGKPFTVNDEGFRGRSYPVTKPNGTYRIVITGPSFPRGSGVSDEEVFSSVLEEMLNGSGLGKTVEIINLSFSSPKIGTMLDIVEKVGMKYNPDLIMFMANRGAFPKNDFVIEPGPKILPMKDPGYKLFTDHNYYFFSKLFFFPGLIYEQRENKLIREDIFTIKKNPLQIIRSGPPDTRTKNTKLDYEGLAEERESLVPAFEALRSLNEDCRVMLYLLRPVKDLNSNKYDIEYRNLIKYYAERYGIGVMDTYFADFSDYTQRQLIIYPGDGHPNEIGHRIYAEYMYTFLVETIRNSP